jgi:hypothetical protein
MSSRATTILQASIAAGAARISIIVVVVLTAECGPPF